MTPRRRALTLRVDCEASFGVDEAVLGQSVPLQVKLSARSDFALGVDVAALELRFGDSHEPISVSPAAPVDGVWRATAAVSSTSAQSVTVHSRPDRTF